MKKLIALANEYISNCDWKDLSLLKLCLFSLGVLVGLALPKKHKRVFTCGAFVVFSTTYILQMQKFLPFFLYSLRKEEE